MPKLRAVETPIEDMFRTYSASYYPDGTVPEQYRQLRDAFFAGAAATFMSVVNVSVDLTEDEAEEFLTRLQREIDKFGQELDRRVLKRHTQRNI